MTSQNIDQRENTKVCAIFGLWPVARRRQFDRWPVEKNWIERFSVSKWPCALWLWPDRVLPSSIAMAIIESKWKTLEPARTSWHQCPERLFRFSSVQCEFHSQIPVIIVIVSIARNDRVFGWHAGPRKQTKTWKTPVWVAYLDRLLCDDVWFIRRWNRNSFESRMCWLRSIRMTLDEIQLFTICHFVDWAAVDGTRWITNIWHTWDRSAVMSQRQPAHLEFTISLDEIADSRLMVFFGQTMNFVVNFVWLSCFGAIAVLPSKIIEMMARVNAMPIKSSLFSKQQSIQLRCRTKIDPSDRLCGFEWIWNGDDDAFVLVQERHRSQEIIAQKWTHRPATNLSTYTHAHMYAGARSSGYGLNIKPLVIRFNCWILFRNQCRWTNFNRNWT